MSAFRLYLPLLALLLSSTMFQHPSEAKPLFVATVPALGQIAEAIAGIDAKVQVLSKVGQDPNVFSPRPAHAYALSQASLLITVGYGLEANWLLSLIKRSGNEKIYPGTDGFFNGADAIEAIGVPRGMVSKESISWSPDKNPYWWLDPEMGIKVAKLLAVRMGEVDPVNAARYMQRSKLFVQAVSDAIPEWKEIMAIHVGTVLTYHNTYVYFMDAMGIDLAGFIEPKSGIEPSTRYMDHLLNVIRDKDVRLIWVEPYNNRAIAKRIADEAGIRLMVLPDAVEGSGTEGYIGMFNKMVERVARWSQ